MTRTDSTKRPDVEVVTATVVDGMLAAGDVADAPVPWWSFTKTVLAAAALVLVDAGRLTLDTPLAGRRYTLRQLLQHRAGVPDYGSLDAYHDAVARGRSPWPVGKLLARVYSHAPGFEPGTSWMYSNVGYLFVRQLIEHATGEEIGEALSHLVLTPLGIAHAGFARTPDELVGTRWGNAGTLSSGMGLSRAHGRIARRRGAVARPIAARRSAVLGLVARHARELPSGRADPGPALAGAGLWSRIDDRNHRAAELHGTHRAGTVEHGRGLPFSGAGGRGDGGRFRAGRRSRAGRAAGGRHRARHRGDGGSASSGVGDRAAMPGAGTDKTRNWIETAGADRRSGRAAARREHRRGGARDGEFRAGAAAAGQAARRLAEHAGAALGLGRRPHSRRRRCCSTTWRRRSPTAPLVLATTARAHDQAKPVLGPDEAAAFLAPHVAAGENVAVLFGRERYGLENDEVALADRIVTFPVNPAFASLNLAQAVALVAYEWFKLASGGALPFAMPQKSAPAGKQQVQAFFANLERELDAVEYFRPLDKRATMLINLRNIFARMQPTQQDIQTLHGIVDGADRRPQGPGARRRARRRGSGGAARAAGRIRRRARAGRARARCAGWRGSCAAIRPRPSACCGRRSPRTAASPAAASSGRCRSGRTSPISSRSRCAS